MILQNLCQVNIMQVERELKVLILCLLLLTFQQVEVLHELL